MADSNFGREQLGGVLNRGLQVEAGGGKLEPARLNLAGIPPVRLCSASRPPTVVVAAAASDSARLQGPKCGGGPLPPRPPLFDGPQRRQPARPVPSIRPDRRSLSRGADAAAAGAVSNNYNAELLLRLRLSQVQSDGRLFAGWRCLKERRARGDPRLAPPRWQIGGDFVAVVGKKGY